MKHLRLDVALDLQNARISGSVAHTFAPINNGVSGIDLDAVGLEIASVRLHGGGDLEHDLTDGRLHVSLGRPFGTNEEATVVVDFAGSPLRGIYFIRPDAAYP